MSAGSRRSAAGDLAKLDQRRRSDGEPLCRVRRRVAESGGCGSCGDDPYPPGFGAPANALAIRDDLAVS